MSVSEGEPMTQTERFKRAEKCRLARVKAASRGLCGLCYKRPTAPDRGRCVRCLKTSRAVSATIRERYRSEGLCGACGKFDPEEGRRLCTECTRKRREYQARRYELGMVPMWLTPSERDIIQRHRVIAPTGIHRI